MPHSCGETRYCYACREKKAKDHECSHKIPTDKDKKKMREKQENWKVLVYDMECIVASSGTFKGKNLIFYSFTIDFYRGYG